MLNAIHDLRTMHGLSRRQLADAVGVSDSTMARWESGGLSVDGAVRVARFFGVSVDELLRVADVQDMRVKHVMRSLPPSMRVSLMSVMSGLVSDPDVRLMAADYIVDETAAMGVVGEKRG